MTWSTPEKQPKKKTSQKTSLPGVLKFALIIVGGFLAGRFITSLFDGGDSAQTSNVSALLVIPAIIISVFLVLVLHEAGHVIGGKLTGSRFTIFVVGPLKLQATKDGISFGLNKSLALAGGIGGTAPTNPRNLRAKMAVMTAGGPVMSFVVAGAAFALGNVASGFIGVLLQAVALMSLLIGIVTLLPVSNGGFFTDGRRLIMLFRGGSEAERWCAIAALGGASMLGERPREWDKELIRKSLSPADGSIDDAGASLNAFHHSLDLGEVDEARELLQRALDAENVPGILRSQVLLEAAFFHATFDGDPEEARALYSLAKPGSSLEKSLPLRAEAAILLREGEVEKAKDTARRALKELGDSMSPGAARLEREWLEELESGRFPRPSVEEKERNRGE